MSFYTDKGAGNRGIEYEHLHIANIIQQLVQNPQITNFHVSSNNNDLHPFDDVFIKIESKTTENYAIQLKHKRTDNKFLGVDRLQNSKGDFSINTYFSSFDKLKAKVDKFLLVTNIKSKLQEHQRFKLNNQDFEVEVLKCTQKSAFQLSGKCSFCYKFKVVGNPNCKDEKVKQYRLFFDRFYLYTDQENPSLFRESVSKKFQDDFCCEDMHFEKFIKMITDWYYEKRKKHMLNKVWMQRVIALCILCNRIEPISTKPFCNVNYQILREVISIFDISFFKSNNNVGKLWGNYLTQLGDLAEINNTRIKYNLSDNHIKEITEIDSLTTSKLLWIKEKCPLIVCEHPSVYKAIELCPHAKYIVIGEKNLYRNSKLKIFRDLSNFDKDDPICEKLLDCFKLVLQGKPEVSVKDLLKVDKKFAKIFTTDVLLQMTDGPLAIDGQPEKLAEPYIERYLSLNVIDHKYLEQITDKTTIVLTYTNSFQELKNKLLHHNFINLDEVQSEIDNTCKVRRTSTQRVIDEMQLENSINNSTIFVTKKMLDNKEFLDVCGKSKTADLCHHFKLGPNQNLEWIRSTKVTDLRKHVKSKCNFIEEQKLWNSTPSNKVGIIIGDPGMGKSELMKSLKNNSPSHIWTILIYPKDIYNFLSDGHSLDHFTHFLLETKYKDVNSVERHYLETALRTKNVLFVWDAIDEISSEHLEVITELIYTTSENGFYQWITSRSHLKLFLEAKFQVFSTHIDQFNEKEQVFYIKKRLKDINNEKTINVIIERIKSTFVLVEHKDILGIPLQIFIITELFRQEAAKYLDLFNTCFTLTDLYYRYVEEKLKIYYTERAGLNLQNKHAQLIILDSKEKTLERFEKLALVATFPERILKLLNVDCHQFQKTDVSTGIVTEIVNNIPRFIHSSFAEYFAASYLSKHLAFRTILQEILFDPRYTNVRFFFDLLLAKDSVSHVAVLYKNYSLLQKCTEDDLNKKDSGGRNALHLVCSWGQRYTRLPVDTKEQISYIIDDTYECQGFPDTQEYLQSLKFLVCKLPVSNYDTLYNMDPLSYAQKTGSLLAELHIIRKNKLSLSKKDAANILFYAAKYGYDDALDLFKKRKIPWVKTKRTQRNLLHVGVHSEKFISKLLKTKKYRKNVNRPDSTGKTPLYLACSSKSPKSAASLIKNGAKVNLTTNKGTTFLDLASGLGNLKMVKLLVSNGAEVNPSTKKMFSPLYLAVVKGHKEVARFLLESGAKINYSEENGFTALHAAAFKNDESLVRMLIMNRAKIDCKNREGFTPLQLACQEGHQNVAKILLASGCQINEINNDGFTALHIACQNGHEELANYLIWTGANINSTTSHRLTPLYISCEHGCKFITQTLLECGAQVNTEDSYGFTPLYVAAQDGHYDICAMLLKANARVNATDAEGFTPLHVASQNGHTEVVKLISEFTPQISFSDRLGFTPLHLAAQEGNEEIVRHLISKGVAVNATNQQGYTPLHTAAQEGHERVVNLLINGGAKVNMASRDYSFTPLYMASQNGHVGVVEILIQNEADVNFGTMEGYTALHVAAQEGQVAVCQKLVNAGANINCVNRFGETAARVALDNNNVNVYCFLTVAVTHHEHPRNVQN